MGGGDGCGNSTVVSVPQDKQPTGPEKRSYESSALLNTALYFQFLNAIQLVSVSLIINNI